MWKPAEKRRFESAPGIWPSAEEAEQSLLFAPLGYQALHMQNRTWIPAMVPWRSN